MKKTKTNTGINKNISPLDVLTDKQLTFVNQYTQSNDKVLAYRLAFNPQNKTNSQVIRLASTLLNNSKIILAIKHIRQNELKLIENETNYNVSVTKVLNEFSKIAFANVKDLFDSEGKPKQMQDISNELAAAIKDIRTIEDKSTNKVYTEIKLHSKVDALINIAKHLGFYEVDNLQSKANINIANLDSNDLIKLLEIQNKVQ